MARRIGEKAQFSAGFREYANAGQLHNQCLKILQMASSSAKNHMNISALSIWHGRC